MRTEANPSHWSYLFNTNFSLPNPMRSEGKEQPPDRDPAAQQRAQQP